VIDPSGGLGDLDDRVIRAADETVFTEDPVALLRAVRLAAQTGSTIEPRTELMIRTHSGLIGRVPAEVIGEELGRLLSAPGSGHFLSYMDEVGLLRAVIPEVDLVRGVIQPPEHRWDVLEHSLKTAEAFDYLLGQGSWPYADVIRDLDRPPETDDYFAAKVGPGSNRAALLRMAALLHDVSKPSTRTVEPGGKVRFLGHARDGAVVAGVVAARLCFGRREARLLQTAIEHHLRPTQMGWPNLPTPRAINRFLRDTGEGATGILYLSLADHLATRGPALDEGNWRTHVETVKHVEAQRKQAPSRALQLVDGYDIMSFFSLSPGHRVGELLASVREAQASGEVSSREEALSLVGKLLGAPDGARGGNHDGGPN
jgi:poly(A) polymerase